MSIEPLIAGYRIFRQRYADPQQSVMNRLAADGQKPQYLVVACCDSRVDPAIVFQCDPGELFVIRNVANIVPRYKKDGSHHGTSAALEFGICYLNIPNVIIFGHSSCGGLGAFLQKDPLPQDDFISQWVEQLSDVDSHSTCVDEYARCSVLQSYSNLMEFPWIRKRFDQGELTVHRWFFNIMSGEVEAFDDQTSQFAPL